MAVFSIRPNFPVEMCGLQIVSKQIAYHVIREKLHSAIGVMNYKPLARSQ